MPFGLGKKRLDHAPVTSAGLFNPSKLDLITTRDDGVSLYIVQDEAWTSSRPELDSLGEKITTYVAFILDGGLAAQYPAVVGRPWRIVIDSYMGRPDAAAMRALNLTGDAILGYGGELIFHELAALGPSVSAPSTIRAVRLRTGLDEEDLVAL
jgi:hypothetical protein